MWTFKSTVRSGFINGIVSYFTLYFTFVLCLTEFERKAQVAYNDRHNQLINGFIREKSNNFGLSVPQKIKNVILEFEKPENGMLVIFSDMSNYFSYRNIIVCSKEFVL